MNSQTQCVAKTTDVIRRSPALMTNHRNKSCCVVCVLSDFLRFEEPDRRCRWWPHPWPYVDKYQITNCRWGVSEGWQLLAGWLLTRADVLGDVLDLHDYYVLIIFVTIVSPRAPTPQKCSQTPPRPARTITPHETVGFERSVTSFCLRQTESGVPGAWAAARREGCRGLEGLEQVGEGGSLGCVWAMGLPCWA